MHQQLLTQFAELSLYVKSRLVSTESEAANVSIHSTQLLEEIKHMTSMFPDPMIRKALENAIQAAAKSHLEATLRQQPALQQAVSPALEQSEDAFRTVGNNSSWSRKRSASPDFDKRVHKRRRIRCPYQSTVTVKDIFIGRIRLQTDTYQIRTGLSTSGESLFSTDLLERETRFIFHPAQWLLRGGLRYGIDVLFTQATQGFTYQLRTLRTVPDDSLIFEFCQKGNLDGIISLFRRKEASPWDVNSYGLTPLHVSHSLTLLCSCAPHQNPLLSSDPLKYLERPFLAISVLYRRGIIFCGLTVVNSSLPARKIASHSCHVEVCKLLLGEGADPSARTYRFGTSKIDRSQ